MDDISFDDEYGIPVHHFNKSPSQQIRITLNEYKGTKYVDIRLFYRSGDTFKPTRKGVTISTDLYFELLRGILDLGSVLGFDAAEMKKGIDEAEKPDTCSQEDI